MIRNPRNLVGELPNWAVPIEETRRQLRAVEKAHGVSDLTAHNSHHRRTPEAVAAAEAKAKLELAKAERLLMIRARFGALKARENQGAAGRVVCARPAVAPSMP
jgi:signal transduction histidine kinase